MNMKFGEQITEQFQRDKLAEMLVKCTNKQRSVFKRMYPTGPRIDQLAWAITQVKNSLDGNVAVASEEPKEKP